MPEEGTNPRYLMMMDNCRWWMTDDDDGWSDDDGCLKIIDIWWCSSGSCPYH